jgi:GNAT superfamily N-acetyltransferase
MLRPATSDDAPAMAAILFDCFALSLPFLPQLHTLEENERFIRGSLMPEHEVWVAEARSEVTGYIAFRDGWIQHLFVHPRAQAQGIGPALLAKALEDGRAKQLWTFQQNTRARRFYEACGFRAVEFTDGEGNEERTPDVRYIWERT